MLLRSHGGELRLCSEAGRSRSPILTSGLVRVLALLLLQQSAQAADRTWANIGTDFSTAANWAGFVQGSGDRAVFSVAGITQPNLSASLTIQELYFSTIAASGYDLTSSSTSIKLTLTNTGTGTTSAIDAANTS